MATTVTFNGSTYSVPALGDSGWAQGPGNLSAYLIAIASGTLQTTGGVFTLSADVNFGGSFGVIAKYLTSASASPATAGTIRLAIGDTIDWGTANNSLSVTGTDIYWNGVKIAVGSLSLPLAIASGGTGQTTQQAAINALTGSQSSGKYLRSDGTNATLSTIQAADVPTLNQNTTGSSGSCVGNAATATLATSATSATTATNIAGGIASEIPYQTGAGATAFIANGTSGQILTSNGTSAPSWQSVSSAYPPVATRQVLTSGTAATYTTPANCRQLKIRMVGGGGGGAGTSTSTITAGSSGNDTIFNSIHAAGGGGAGIAATYAAGVGGTGGTGTASFRSPGFSGGVGTTNSFNPGYPTGFGGGSLLGGGAAAVPTTSTNNGSNAGANTGGGGSSGSDSTSSGFSGGGGGGGEYVELLISSPSATYTYTVGIGGAGAAVSNAGGNGGSGVIIVDEFY